MLAIKQVFVIASQNFAMWKRSPRVWLTFIIGFVMCLMLSDNVISYAQRYETILQILEPFIWIYGDATSIMLSSLLLILLFADMPFIDQITPYKIIRVNRKIWISAQIVYVIGATLIYNVFLFCIMAFITAPFAFVGNVWSETAALLGYGGSAGFSIPVSIKTMESSMPYECAGMVFLLMLLYSLFIATLMLWLNLTFKGAVGVIGAFAVNIYGFLLNPEILKKIFHFSENLEYKANVLCGWLSPINHATFSMHNFGYDYLPQIKVSIIIFLICIIGFTLISLIKMKTYDFSFVQREG